MNLFKNALQCKNDSRPPVWLMRQAGRYHTHYQNLRRRYSFLKLCMNPEVAAQAALGPVDDFNFDAAILFSDLLFPLDVLGMGLSYNDGPKLAWHLNTQEDLQRLTINPDPRLLSFQSEALQLTRKILNPDKGLLGFVGGPLTLFLYATQGSHQLKHKQSSSTLVGSHSAQPTATNFDAGLFCGFCDKLLDLLAQNMHFQAQAGADCIAILDTAAGEYSPVVFKEHMIAVLKKLLEKYFSLQPTANPVPILYYSKGTNESYWSKLVDLPISAIGIDWNHEMAQVLLKYGDRFAVQGNINPSWLLLESAELESQLRSYFHPLKKLPINKRSGWICGLGHGVLPQTPEKNVRLLVQLEREIFCE